MDTAEYSFYYIGGWSKDKEVSELKENLELIKITSDKLSNEIEERLQQHKQMEVKDQEPVPITAGRHR